MGAVQAPQCARCRRRLASDNSTGVCGGCRTTQRGLLAEPPELDRKFWDSTEMHAALGTWHFGKVLRAYRKHPAHSRALPQEVMGNWLGLTQTQLSRLENGPAPQELDRLIHWARTLRIPPDLLWFRIPDNSRVAVRPVLRRSEPDSPRRAAEERHRMTDRERRTFLSKGIAVSSLPSLGLQDLRHIVAALDDARKYADTAVVQHFRDQLVSCALDDGNRGPRGTLPRVLGLLAAVEAMYEHAKADVRARLLALGALGAEFAGWLYRDVGMLEVSDQWRDRAVERAREAGNRTLEAYALLRKSQGCWDTRDAHRMGELAREAQSCGRSVPRHMKAEAVQQEARSLAMLGEPAAVVDGKLDEAYALVAEAEPSDWGGLTDAGYSELTLGLQTAICLTEAGRPALAAQIYRDRLSEGSLSYRDTGYFSALMATSLALSGEPAEAAAVGLSALQIAEDTSSARTLRELLRLSQSLAPWASHASVRTFDSALRADPTDGR